MTGQPRRALRDAMDRFEAGDPAVTPPALVALASTYADEDLRPLRRAARLLERRGAPAHAAALFRRLLDAEPDDAGARLFLVRHAEAADDPAAAYAFLEPLLAAPPVPRDVLRRALAHLRRLGRTADALALLARALDDDPDAPWPTEQRLRLLVEEDRFEEAAALGARLLDAAAPSVAALLAAYTAAYRAASPAAPALRARLLDALDASGAPDLWLGRLLRAEKDPDGATEAFRRAVARAPGDPVATRELAAMAFITGRLGAEAPSLAAARPYALADSALARGLRAADDLFHAHGGSLEAAARGDTALAALATPAAVFDRLAADPPPRDRSGLPRRGAVLVAGALAAGGAERIVATLFAELRRRGGHEPLRLCLLDFAPGAKTSFFLPRTGLRAEEIEVARGVEPKDRLVTWLPRPLGPRTQDLLDRFRAWRPAVVHATLDLPNVCAGLAAVLAGVPRIILHVHNMRPTELAVAGAYNPDFHRAYRSLLGHPGVTLVGVADAVVRDYLDWCDAPPGTSAVTVHNGFDHDAFATPAARETGRRLRTTLAIGPDAPVIGAAFRFTELKRPDLWVAMAAEVARSHPAARFVLLGDGEQREDTMRRAAALGLGGRIHFPGRVEDIEGHLAAFDLLVLTSRTEGLPNAIVEAAAAGLPTVAFDVGGVADTVLDGETGILVREDTLEALVAAVRRALDDPSWRAAAGRRARDFARARFSLDAMADRIAAVYAGAPPSAVPTLPRPGPDPAMEGPA